ncbi:uncharacterized protein MELLADRAFT_60386 [Melampsora larici-populina 98AG31]|uniref:Uncharacterized protein n=1 Tax=Melampsora larici-populina (strain 98AG31 / pathotype 3-4-7) TaxID=747676 RepID=F4R9X6_MELLP|nr:uncharacterized protein MELLADRAFT_60386 [Melampsora larici-populina 98AG31]EGG10606.1 hypothetical protein MELLADRAFT_60386 [Melampsora larici-populina 98AG31]
MSTRQESELNPIPIPPNALPEVIIGCDMCYWCGGFRHMQTNCPARQAGLARSARPYKDWRRVMGHRKLYSVNVLFPVQNVVGPVIVAAELPPLGGAGAPGLPTVNNNDVVMLGQVEVNGVLANEIQANNEDGQAMPTIDNDDVMLGEVEEIGVLANEIEAHIEELYLTYKRLAQYDLRVIGVTLGDANAIEQLMIGTGVASDAGLEGAEVTNTTEYEGTANSIDYNITAGSPDEEIVVTGPSSYQPVIHEFTNTNSVIRHGPLMRHSGVKRRNPFGNKEDARRVQSRSCSSLFHSFEYVM